jgi:hypothetical protein
MAEKKIKLRQEPNIEIEIGYAMGGQIIDSDEPESLAKVVHVGKNIQYYVKYATYGGDAGHMVNPNGLNHNKSDFTAIDRYGREKYTYRKVRKEVFDLYKKFLETRNIAWLRQAERVI